jgi:hypothetical protein
MKTLRRATFIFSLMIPTLGAHAQLTTTVPDASSLVIPDASCPAPPSSPGIQPTQHMIDQFDKDATRYRLCMTEYAQELGKIGQAYGLMGQKYIDKGNETIETYNKFAADVRKRNGQ